MCLIVFENANIIAIKRVGSEEVEFFFKSGCSPKIIEMYKNLQKSYKTA